MLCPRRLFRVGWIVALALGSVLFAAALWWALLPAEAISRLSTAAALGLLGLFVLPVATLAATLAERSIRLKRQERSGGGQRRIHPGDAVRGAAARQARAARLAKTLAKQRRRARA